MGRVGGWNVISFRCNYHCADGDDGSVMFDLSGTRGNLTMVWTRRVGHTDTAD